MKRVLLTFSIVTCLVTAGLVWAGQEPCEAGLDHCLTAMGKKLKAKGWVGVELEQEDDGTLVITRVIPDSPAAAAGLHSEDRILALNGVSYAGHDRQALKAAYAEMVPDNTITYTIDRGGKNLDVELDLINIPEPIRAQWIARHLVEGHSQQARHEPHAPGDS